MKALSFFQGLPTYFGGKRKLVPWIFGTLNQHTPRQSWSDLVFVDAFLGGGAISLTAKAYGFKQILANDWSLRSQVIGEAILTNSGRKLTEHELLFLTTSPHEGGFIEREYSPSVFSKRHARKLDILSSEILQTPDPRQKQLLRLLFWHLASRFVCFPTSLGTSNRPYAEALDGLLNWSSLNPKRFTDGSLQKLCQPIWPQVEAIRQDINQSIFAGPPVKLSCQEVTEFICNLQGDVLYLDPPYAGTVSYEKVNRILDTLLFGSDTPQLKEVSPFSKDLAALDSLLESARHLPVWLLSYGNKLISADELKRQVQKHVPHRTLQVLTRQYTHMAHVSKDKQHQELLVIATEKGG